MTDSFITVSQGGPKPEDDIPDGVHLVMVTEIKDPKTVTARRGARAGQEVDLIDWIFAIDEPGTPLHDRIHQDSTSTASGPRSKMYEWLTALFGGRAPAIGQQFRKQDLIGRAALATFNHDEGGWPRIAALGAVPPSMLAQRVAASTGVQTSGTAAEAAPPAAVPIAQQAAVEPDPAGTFVGAPAQQPMSSDNLPF